MSCTPRGRTAARPPSVRLFFLQVGNQTRRSSMETREQFWVTIVVEGTPVAKGRPVFGRGHVYTPAAARKFETDAGWMARAAMKGRPPLQGRAAWTC